MDTNGKPDFLINKTDLATNFNVVQRGQFSIESAVAFISSTLPLLISAFGSDSPISPAWGVLNSGSVGEMKLSTLLTVNRPR